MRKNRKGFLISDLGFLICELRFFTTEGREENAGGRRDCWFVIFDLWVGSWGCRVRHMGLVGQVENKLCCLKCTESVSKVSVRYNWSPKNSFVFISNAIASLTIVKNSMLFKPFSIRLIWVRSIPVATSISSWVRFRAFRNSLNFSPKASISFLYRCSTLFKYSRWNLS